VPASDEGETRERLAAIGEIAAEVAHELRNVLQVVAASAYLARQDPTASLPHIVKIERNARLAQTIVDDLMALARGEPAHAEPVALAEIVAAARAEIDPSAAEWDDAFDPALRVLAHPGLLTRVLHVLYENAIQASAPRPPRVTTRATLAASMTAIDVSDDGPGVPVAVAPRIFEPLVTSRPGGSGLGLAMAKRIIDAHAGAITLVSPTPATFRIALPSPG
jgi:signal transduction histidine kinase